MKTSFYFVAWILVYVLIDILNIQLLKENSFVAACVIVWGGAYIMNKVFASNVQNQQVRDVAKFYEKIYTDDVSGLRKEVFKDLILEISATVYLLLAIIGFSTLNAGEFVVYVVFGFFLLLSCKNTYKLLVKYNSIKNKNYCCPIKVDRRKKIRLGYRFDGGRVCFFDFQAPSVEKRGLGG